MVKLMFPSSAPSGAAAPERNVYTVSRLNREVRLLLENGMPVVWLEGELSNFSAPASGHWYFSLKDREAQIRCAMFRTRNGGVGFTPKAGQHVLVRGRVTMYEPRGDLQLIVEHMEEAGIGALKREFERLKAKLAAEGLFALERKRPLPRFPRRIGVVTSPTGAAIRDILHILARRFPPASVIVYPTAVQGAAAVPSIIQALSVANARAECDVIILARGGGSIEDLWAFNDEQVARAIYASTLPIVSGVGHEIDFTIADFVADVRAPTPSGAAELVVPDAATLMARLRTLRDRLGTAVCRQIAHSAQHHRHLAHRLQQAHPGSRMAQQAQRFDELEQRLVACVRRGLQRRHEELQRAAARLMRAHAGVHVARVRAHVDELELRLIDAWRHQHQRQVHRLALASRALDSVSPLAVLARGYAMVTTGDGEVVRRASELEAGQLVHARVADGTFQARVVKSLP